MWDSKENTTIFLKGSPPAEGRMIGKLVTRGNDRQFRDILADWRYHPVHNGQLSKRVWIRIHNSCLSDLESSQSKGGFKSWIRVFFHQPVYALFTLMLLVSVTLGSANLAHVGNRMNHNREMLLTYRQIINTEALVSQSAEQNDPLKTMVSHRSVSNKTFARTMDWMEKEVSLAPGQYLLFRQIHKEYFNEFESLHVDLLSLEKQYREFERQRIAGKDIDLLKVYDNVTAQKEICQQALQVRQEFIDRILRILNTEQRGKYGELVMIPDRTPNTNVRGKNRETTI